MGWVLVGLTAYAAGMMQFWYMCQNAPVQDERAPPFLHEELPASALGQYRRDGAQHDRQVPAQAPPASVI